MFTKGQQYSNGTCTINIADVVVREITLVYGSGMRYVISRFKLAEFLATNKYNLA